jgi:hypothetical protein
VLLALVDEGRSERHISAKLKKLQDPKLAPSVTILSCQQGSVQKAKPPILRKFKEAHVSALVRVDPHSDREAAAVLRFHKVTS